MIRRRLLFSTVLLATLLLTGASSARAVLLEFEATLSIESLDTLFPTVGSESNLVSMGRGVADVTPVGDIDAFLSFTGLTGVIRYGDLGTDAIFDLWEIDVDGLGPATPRRHADPRHPAPGPRRGEARSQRRHRHDFPAATAQHARPRNRRHLHHDEPGRLLRACGVRHLDRRHHHALEPLPPERLPDADGSHGSGQRRAHSRRSRFAPARHAPGSRVHRLASGLPSRQSPRRLCTTLPPLRSRARTVRAAGRGRNRPGRPRVAATPALSRAPEATVQRPALGAIDPRSLAAFRIGLACLVLADLVYRALDLEAHYSDAGVLPASSSPTSWPSRVGAGHCMESRVRWRSRRVSSESPPASQSPSASECEPRWRRSRAGSCSRRSSTGTR